MSTVSTVFEETDLGNMTLKFLVDGNEKTRYEYNASNGHITLEKREKEHINTFVGFVNGMQLVSDWIKKILVKHRSFLKTQKVNALTKHTSQCQIVKSGQLKSVFKIGKTKIINTTYNPQTQMITFGKRPRVSMFFKDFQSLFYFQQYCAKLMELVNASCFQLETDIDDIM